VKRFLSLLAAFVTLSAAAPQPQPLPPMDAAKWRDDVDYFARELAKRHINAFHAVTREQFDQAVAELRDKTKTATDEALIVGLLKITAMVGDAHTNVHLPASVHRLPVAVAMFGDDYYITRAADDAKSLLGARIVSIDGVPVAEVEKRLRSVISRDESEPLVRGLLPQYLLIGEVLRGLGITRDAVRARLTVATVEGEQTADVALLPGAASPAAWKSAASSEPLSRQHPEDPFFVQMLEPQKTMYVNFRRYDGLAEHARELWKLVDAKGVEKIVIDLRQNGGGDYKVGRRYLVSELKARPKLKAFVLVGNRTFSAAMNNAIDFRNDGHAMLVGQPIGEKPNSYQENDEMTLPKSHLVVSYSTRFYKFQPDDAPPIVTPDKLIAPTWSDFVAGRDAALEWILAQP
jgi:hypothetical protein